MKVWHARRSWKYCDQRTGCWSIEKHRQRWKNMIQTQHWKTLSITLMFLVWCRVLANPYSTRFQLSGGSYRHRRSSSTLCRSPSHKSSMSSPLALQGCETWSPSAQVWVICVGNKMQHRPTLLPGLGAAKNGFSDRIRGSAMWSANSFHQRQML